MSNRRLFLKQSTLLSSGLLLPVDKFVHPQNMLLKTIPSTGEKIPAIGLGSWLTFDVGTNEVGSVAKVIKAFYDGGGRVIDSSPMYGRSESAIGTAADQLGLTSKLWFDTKVWTTGESRGKEQIEQSHQLFKTWPKLYLVHNLQDIHTHYKTLQALKQEGKIKYIGFTHYLNSSHRDMADYIKSLKPDFIQINLSIRNTAAEDFLIPLAADLGVAVIINRPFETGALFNAVGNNPLPSWAKEYSINSWAAYFLKYIVSHPGVTCVIPATSKENHVKENMEAGYGNLPDRKRMVEYFLKISK